MNPQYTTKKHFKQLKNEKQATILSLVIELIEKNNGYYSKELGDFLVQVGVEVPANYLQFFDDEIV